jgi:hypothetical protein
MRKLLIATILGGVIGFTASAATSRQETAASTINCGPITCTSHEECCVSPHPFTYRCVKPGTCPYNN